MTQREASRAEVESLQAEVTRLREENVKLWSEREEPHKTVQLYLNECNRLETELEAEQAKVKELLDAATEVAIPPGYVLVPEVPTEKMILSSWQCFGETIFGGGEKHRISVAWQAMLQAAKEKQDVRAN